MTYFRKRKIGSRGFAHLRMIGKMLRHADAEKRSEAKKKLLVLCGFVGIATILAGVIFVTVLAFGLPSTAELESLSLPESTRIFDRNGELLYAIHGEENREVVPLDQISKHLVNATLAMEDDGFYKHPGFEIGSIMRCSIQTILGKSSCGGSTITQQFAKNNFLTSERSIIRKLRELILAIKIEHSFSKDKILELYLNKIPYGNNAYGIQMAAKIYFSKDAKDLTLAESAVLAAIPQRPTRYSPYGENRYSHLTKTFTPEELKKRKIEEESDLKEDEYTAGLIGQEAELGEGKKVYIHGRTDLVLKRMEEVKFLTKEEKEKTLAETHTIEFRPVRTNIRAPHFVLYVKELLEKKYGKDLVEQGGLKVTTTLDWKLQEKAEEIIEKYAESNLTNYNVNNESLVALDAKKAQILVMVGSRDYFNEEIDGNVNVALRPRQPGSAFKPIVYSQAFLNGYGPATPLYDVKTQFGPDTPKNFDGKFMGAINIRTALGKSRNIPASKAYYLAGKQESIIKLAKSFGVTSLDENVDYGYPLALGAGEVSLLEMVTAYSVFANNGIKYEVNPILEVQNAKGEMLEKFEENQKGIEVLDPQVAFLISNILSDTNVTNTAKLIIPGYTVAAKTGTSTKKDEKGVIFPSNLLAIGYTPKYVVGVWAGNTDGSKLSAYGESSTGAAPIWHDFFKELLKDQTNESFQIPSGIQKIQVSKTSGLLPGPDTPADAIIEEYFTSFGVPKDTDQSFQKLMIDKSTGGIATPYCPKDQIIEKVYRIHHSILPDVYPNWEAGVQAWVENAKTNGEIETPPDTCPVHDETTSVRAPTIKILSPAAYSTLSPGRIEVQVEFNAPLGVDHVEFYLDDQLQYTTKQEPYTGYVRISPLIEEGTELKIKVIGYDKVQYSTSTQITIKR